MYSQCRQVEGGDLFDKVISIDKYPQTTAKLLFYQMSLCLQGGHQLYVSVDRCIVSVDRWKVVNCSTRWSV